MGPAKGLNEQEMGRRLFAGCCCRRKGRTWDVLVQPSNQATKEAATFQAVGMIRGWIIAVELLGET